MPLNLNGPEIQAMTEKIAAENKLTVQADLESGLTVKAGRTWTKGSLAGFFRLDRQKKKTAGIEAELKF